MSWFRMRSYFTVLWCFSTLFFQLLHPSLALNFDGTLLLSFKYSILNDPLSVLDNWNYDDETPCLWTGVMCAPVETPFGTPDMLRVISLVLRNSKLLGSIPEELGFIEHLRTLDLSGNFLNGTLPNSLFNESSELQVLSLSSNAITGWLPEFSGAGGLKNLKLLNLSDNALAGSLPQTLPSLQNLTAVYLKRNFFSGTIPNGFLYVEVLDLSSNLLNGSLPLEFGGERLRYLNLSTNKLSGLVPPEFAKKIPANATIDLSFNNLTGRIPESMALSNQKTESFRGNIDLCGKPLKKLCTIPSSLSAPPNISTTNSSAPAIAAIPQTMDSNPLPSSRGTATNAAQIQGQHRLKPGMIAGIAIGGLAGIAVLAIICLYVYQLRKRTVDEGSKEIPLPAVETQQKDNVEDSQLSIAKETASRSLPSWSCLMIRNGEETSEATTSDCDDENKNIDFGHQVDHYHEKEQSTKYKNERSLVMVDGETELDIETLLKASAYILGSSAAVSIVYKAVLEDGTAFAVRRIGESGVERFKDFETQVKAIAKLRHPNLVMLRGFYWGDDEKLVIYDYVSNGSLANAGFRNKIGSSPYHMPFQARLKVAKGVARGLAYIHEKRHVHGNIKPSNILLTPEMEPKISDFGIHWLMHGKNSYKTDAFSSRHFGSMRSSTTTISSSSHDGLHDHHSINGSPYIAPAGFMGCTSPYHAPESLNNLKPNSKWDVYSFGILLLELLTGKVFSDRELGQWTASLQMEDRNQVLRMADARIRGDVASREDAMLDCFKLGFSCASLNPQKRPSMKDALQVLDKIQSSPSY